MNAARFAPILLALALCGCGPSLIARGSGHFSRGANVVLYPLVVTDVSLDPPFGAGNRSDFESAFVFSFEHALPRPSSRECTGSRTCVHVRVTAQLRQAYRSPIITRGRLFSGSREPSLEAEGEASVSDGNGRLIEVVGMTAHTAGELGFELGRYLAVRL